MLSCLLCMVKSSGMFYAAKYPIFTKLTNAPKFI